MVLSKFFVLRHCKQDNCPDLHGDDPYDLVEERPLTLQFCRRDVLKMVQNVSTRSDPACTSEIGVRASSLSY